MGFMAGFVARQREFVSLAKFLWLNNEGAEKYGSKNNSKKAKSAPA
jgi:hypothetical protein